MANYRDYTPELLSRIFDHRLHQDDIKRILDSLSTEDRENFLDKISETLEKFTALLEVSNRLADSLDLNVLFTRLVELTTEALHAERGTIFLNDKRTGELFSRIAMGEGMSEIRFPNHVGIAGSVFTDNASVLIPDAYADPRFNPTVDKKTGYRTRNILTVPVRNHEGRPVGVIQILNKINAVFTQSDLSMLEAMGAQASAALVKAQLYEDIERARHEEKELFEITKAISTEIHLQPLMQRIMATTTTILEADRSTLFLHDPKTDELWAMVAEGLGTKEIRFPAHLGIAGSVFTSGKVTNIPDAYADPRFNPEVDIKTGYKTDTILCMPVFNKDGVAIGVIQSLNKKDGPFTEQDERRIQSFAAQAAIAIENARLFEDVLSMKNYNESILESMSSGLITFDEEKCAEKVNRVAKKILAMDENKILTLPAAEIFYGPNEWASNAVDAVMETGEANLAVDAKLVDAGGIGKSVNLTTLPLINAKKKVIGTLVALEDISREKRLKGTLARYMTKEVADQLMEAGEGELGGQSKEATVLFSDIRSFTTISEQMGATETVAMLNDYFTDMVDVIFEHGGILDKYIGDAIMAVYGTPFATPDDADKAVRTAIGMIRALQSFNSRRKAAGKDTIDIGIGLNTAEIVAGNIGSLKRMDYTVIGDGVNLAARLEGANKMYGSHILVSEFTVAKLKGDYRMREADLIRVKGKRQPVSIYEVLDYHDEENYPALSEMLDIHPAALAAYRSRDFAGARNMFERILTLQPTDKLARLYIDRCRSCEENPPPVECDGVFDMTTK